MPSPSSPSGHRCAKCVVVFLLALLTAGYLNAGEKDAVKSGDKMSEAWKQVADSDGVVICRRVPTDSALEEFRAVGEVDAAPSSVFALVNDPEAYPHFMPYTSECRVLQRFESGTVTYQRLDLPLVSDRDYTLRSVYSRAEGADGAIYFIHWAQANDLGPAPLPGVERVKVCRGSWVIEPASLGKSRVTYTVCSGAGESLPACLSGLGSRVAIRKIFAAIRKEVRAPKYEDAKE